MNEKTKLLYSLLTVFLLMFWGQNAFALNCPPGKAPRSGHCVKCNVGYHSPNGTVCIRCDGNTGSNQARTQCVPCPKGTKKQGDRCVQCYPGRYQNKTGKNVCWKCPLGTYSNTRGAHSCTPCPKGKFASQHGSRSCTACPVGHYALKKGSRRCKRCPEGFAAHTTGMTFCNPCQIGSRNNYARTFCEPCPKGTYGVKQGWRFICKLCPPGRVNFYTGKVGMSSCVYCAPGYQASYARDKCESCPVNWFGPSAGRCYACPRGWFSPSKGSRKCTKCPSGQVAGVKNNGYRGYCKPPNTNRIN